MSRIREINEFEYRQVGNDTWHHEDGFEIVCDGGTISIVIDGDGDCCEQWGHVSSEDCFSKFIGAKVLGVRVVDTELKMYDEIPDYETEIMFVNLDTSAGLLQFVLYNSHNGYYGHAARVVAPEFQVDEGTVL